MSSATSISHRPRVEPPLERRRFELAKLAVALVIVLLLAYLGQQGRRHAMLRARINEVVQVRDELLERLDEDQALGSDLLVSTRGEKALGPINQKIRDLSDNLRQQIERFESDYESSRLTPPVDLEIRTSKAALANAEQRFSDALNLLSEADEKGSVPGQPHSISSLLAIQIRGNAWYGLSKWAEALQCYQHLLMLQPNRLLPLARIANCEYAQRNANEALAAFGDLTKALENRGNGLLIQGKLEEAEAQYEKAIQIESWLCTKENRNELVTALASKHSSLGAAFFLQEKPQLAAAHYEKAIEIQRLLIERQSLKELGNNLAASYYHLGNALLSQQQLESSLTNYDAAIALQTRLPSNGGAEWEDDLARSHNNRGVVLRAQGKMDDAIGEFQQSVNILSPLLEQVRRDDLAAQRAQSPATSLGGVKLEVAFEYTERNLEVSSRARFSNHGRQRALAVALAISFKNLGYAHLLKRNGDDAFRDFTRAMDIYGRLVEQEQQRDLALEFANSISSVAWLYATRPDTSSRDGPKAKAYALKACELSEWTAVFPVVTLAAACAETGDFEEAVKWQQRGINLASAEEKPQLLSRLQVYQSHNPYRLQ